jgi:hypothetical protein
MHVFLHLSFREELGGLPRANNAKDVDWSKVANSISIETTTKPQPIKISVSEVLKRARPMKQTADSTALLSAVDPHGKQLHHRPATCTGLSVCLKSETDTFGVVTPCTLVHRYKCVGGTCCSLL